MNGQKIFMSILGIGTIGFGIWYFMRNKTELETPPVTNQYDLPSNITYPTRDSVGYIYDPVAQIGGIGKSVTDLGGTEYFKKAVADALAPFNPQPVVRTAGATPEQSYIVSSGGGSGRNVKLVVEQPTQDERQTESFQNLVKRYGSEEVALQQRAMFRTSLAPTNIASSRNAPVQTAGTLQVRSSTPVANLQSYSKPASYVGLR